MKWIGQNIYDQVSKFRNTVDFSDTVNFSEDVTLYQPVNNANPTFSIGASDDERFRIIVDYQGTDSQIAQIISFNTLTESGVADDGRFVFAVDGVSILDIDDDGIDFRVGMGIAINGTDILTDSSGTATLSNIDALDATTIATFNAALTAGDITGVEAGTGLSGGGTSGNVVLNVDASQPSITTLAGVTAIGTAGNPLTVTSDQVIFASAAASDPLVNIQNTANDASAPRLRFTKNRGGDAVDSDNVGEISFHSYDDGTPSTQEYARIKAQVHDATSDEESGSLQFFVANHDGDVQTGLSIVGGDQDGEIDVNLGLGAASTTTVAGTLTMGSTATLDNSGQIVVASQPNVTTLAGLTSLGAAGATTDIAAGDLTMYNAVNDGVPTISIGSSATERLEIKALYASGTQEVNQAVFTTYTASGTSNRGRFVFSVDETAILQIWDAGLNLSAKLQIDGTDVIGDSSGTVKLSNIGLLDATTEATIEAAMDTLPNVTSLGTLTNLDVDNININGDTITASGDLAIVATGNDITVDTDNFTIESATTASPEFTLLNTNDGNKPVKQTYKRTSASPATGDGIAEIKFQANNDADELITYAIVAANNEDAADGAEEGNYEIYIKNTDHATAPRSSFKLTGNGAATDATIGFGAASTTTIAGTLMVTGTEINSPGRLKLNPTAGSDILLDSTISVDAGVVTGATSITSTAFVGTLSTASQPNVTSLGTLTALNVDNINLNSKAITVTGDTDDTFVITTGESGATFLTTVDTAGADGHLAIVADGNITLKPADNLDVQILNDSGTAQVTISPNSNTMFRMLGRGALFGPASAASSSIERSSSPHDTAGGEVTVQAGNTTAGTTDNIAGGNLIMAGGRGKGSGAGGDIIFQTANAGGSGSSLNSLATALTISDDLSATFAGNIELGHATDTTIARSAAGVVTIESNPIQTTNVHHHFIHAGWFFSYPYSRYIPLNGSLNEQNTATLSPEYVNFTWPYDGFVKTMWLRSETDMGSTNLKLYKGASGATVTTALGNVTATVGATATVEFDFTSVTNTYSQGDTMAILCAPTADPDGGQNITIELVFDLTT